MLNVFSFHNRPILLLEDIPCFVAIFYKNKINKTKLLEISVTLNLCLLKEIIHHILIQKTNWKFRN